MAASELANAAMYRLLKKAGAPRISEESAAELRRATEELASRMAASAVEMCGHAGRRTVMAEDVRLAARRYLGA